MRFYLLFILLAFSSLFSVANNLIYVSHPDSTYDITNRIEFLEDCNAELTIDDFLNEKNQYPFEKNKKTIFQKGNTASVYWVKFDVVNHLKHEVLVYLSAEWLTLIEYYEVKDNELVRYREMGAMIDRDHRALAISKPAIVIPYTNKQKHTIYLRFKTEHALTTIISIASIKEIYKHYVKELVIYNIFLGIVAIIFFYNLYLSIITRRQQYVLFTIYIFMLALNISYVKGYHTFFHSEYFTRHSNILTALMLIFLVFSMTSLTEIRRMSKRIFHLRFVVIVIPAVSITLNVLGYVRLANRLIDLSALVGVVWGVSLGIVVVKNGGAYAKNIVLAFAAFVTGGVIQILLGYGVFEVNFFTTNAYVIGSGLEVIFLASALAIKINQFRRERYLAQKERIEEIKRNQRLIREQNEILEDKVRGRTQQLQETNRDLELTLNYVNEQKNVIEENNRYFLDGIKYAKNIQDAMLPPSIQIRELIPDSFIYFQPKDILSGDFYWYGEKNDLIIIAAVDCEGHGVSGAMLSMMGFSFLNEIVFEEGLVEPSKILDRLNVMVYKQLNRSRSEQCDTMDMSLVVIDNKENEVRFAGARNSLFMQTEEGMKVIKGEKLSIGEVAAFREKAFVTHTIKANKGQQFFIASDGMQDQFGGPDDKKMMNRKFREVLSDVALQPSPQDKKELIESTLLTWKGDNVQTDDILVIGFKLD